MDQGDKGLHEQNGMANKHVTAARQHRHLNSILHLPVPRENHSGSSTAMHPSVSKFGRHRADGGSGRVSKRRSFNLKAK